MLCGRQCRSVDAFGVLTRICGFALTTSAVGSSAISGPAESSGSGAAGTSGAAVANEGSELDVERGESGIVFQLRLWYDAGRGRLCAERDGERCAVPLCSESMSSISFFSIRLGGMLLRAAVRWRTVAAAGGACAARAWARCEEDLYATLGVGRRASAEEIRRAYKLRASANAVSQIGQQGGGL